MYSYAKGQNYFHTRIEELRKESQGNYDAVLGMVDNFDWEFQKDGSYLITLNLITIGSVISSLKGNLNIEGINYPNPSKSSSSNPEEDRPTALETAIDLLSQCKTVEDTVDVDKTITEKFLTSISSIIPGTVPTWTNVAITRSLIPIKEKLSNEEETLLGIKNDGLSNGGTVIACNAAFGKDAFSTQYYLRLGTLLEFINKKLLLYGENEEPSNIEIDTSIDTYCYSNGFSFPSDPEKMIISYSKVIGNDPNNALNIFSSPKTQIDKFHNTVSINSKIVNVGSVMNLYFNRQYLHSVIKQYTDEDKGLSIQKFIETLLNTANSQLGNVNKLKLRITNKSFNETVFSAEGEAEYKGFDGTGEGDVVGSSNAAISNSQFQEATFTSKVGVRQVLEIYDEVAFTETPTFPTFNVYGFSPESGDKGTENFIDQEGSFVTDLNLKTNIDKNLTTTIAIGAQSGGRAAGYDSMVFSKWNVGLVDRVIPSKLDIEKAKREGVEKRNDWKKLLNTYRSYLSKLSGAKVGKLESDSANNFFERYFSPTISATLEGYIIPNIFLSGNKEEEPSFTKFQSIQTNFFNKVLSWDAERKNVVTPFQGFLPINLSLTLDGLSGIKIFDKLTVNSRFLPENYTNTLNFIITELDHIFQNNKWTTKIGTLSIPKLFPDKLASVSTNAPVNPEDQAEVQTIENIISEEVKIEEPRTDTLLNPSYFQIKPDVWRGVGLNGIRPMKKSKRIERDGIDEILDLLNASPYVQTKFKSFFLQILDTYPEGYAFIINDATRFIGDRTSSTAMTSAHQYGLAIDMGIREAAPKDQKDPPISSNKLYQSERTLANVKAIRSFGLPDVAYENGITWGGDYTDGWKYDVVHFSVAPNWGKNSGNESEVQKTELYKRLVNVESLISQSKTKVTARNVLKFVSIKDFVLLEMKNGKPEYTTDTKRIFFGGNTAQQRLNKKEIGYVEP